MSLTLQSEEPALSVLHVQYPEWPDHGVPKDTRAVREIFKRISNVPNNLGPIVVHCRFAFDSDFEVIVSILHCLILVS